MTTQTVAKNLNIDEQLVIDWENGDNLDISCFPLLSSYFNVSIDQFFNTRPCREDFSIKTNCGKNCPFFEDKRRNKMIASATDIKILNGFVGDNVYCPCCGKFFSRFEEYIIPTNEQNLKFFQETELYVICPYCHSSPRHRIVCSVFEKEMLFFENVLLVAPHTSITSWFRRKNISYVTADLYNYRADLRLDIQKTGLSDNVFDFISCDHVLETVEKDLTRDLNIKQPLDKKAKMG